jgi:hypothetical protein
MILFGIEKAERSQLTLHQYAFGAKSVGRKRMAKSYAA